MIQDIRIKYNGVRVRLVGFGFRKYHNLRILETGLASIKERLSRGIGENDAPTEPLTKKYARFKAYARRLKPVRDLDLTGRLLDSIKPRYSDDRQAIADADTQKNRTKARKHKQLLMFSERDQAAMLDTASQLFGEGVERSIGSVFGFGLARATPASALRNRGGISDAVFQARVAAATPRSAIRNRRTYFGR